jgi:hypothetical protein
MSILKKKKKKKGNKIPLFLNKLIKNYFFAFFLSSSFCLEDRKRIGKQFLVKKKRKEEGKYGRCK